MPKHASKAPNVVSEADRTPSIPAAEALSFLKDTKGVLTWTARDLAKCVNISTKAAVQVLAVIQLQGYAKRASGSGSEWITTPAGEEVSGSKPPRFSRESVQKAVATLSDRIKALNKDTKAHFKVSEAVAFGDFLSDRPQVQAANVGIHLVARHSEANEMNSASNQSLQRTLLKQLRGKTALLNLQPYQEWMSHRCHRRLL